MDARDGPKAIGKGLFHKERKYSCADNLLRTQSAQPMKPLLGSNMNMNNIRTHKNTTKLNAILGCWRPFPFYLFRINARNLHSSDRTATLPKNGPNAHRLSFVYTTG